MSDFVVHFTRGGRRESGYNSMISINWDRTLKPGHPFGIGRTLCPNPASQLAVCFSEVPPGE